MWISSFIRQYVKEGGELGENLTEEDRRKLKADNLKIMLLFE
jgi:hypothetical protein